MTDHTNLDRLIDDVARDITAQEPPAHLRTRILARLDERRSPRRAWLLIPVAASAAAVLVSIAVVNNRPGRVPEATPLASSTDVARATPDRGEIVASALDSHSVSTGVTTVARQNVSSSDAAAWREELMPSLPAIAALGIAEIQPDTLTIPQLNMKPLVVAPIDDSQR